MNGYTITERTPTMIVTSHADYGVQSWWLARMTKKNHAAPCALCGMPLGKEAYRPLTNGYNRMVRICVRHAPNGYMADID